MRGKINNREIKAKTKQTLNNTEIGKKAGSNRTYKILFSSFQIMDYYCTLLYSIAIWLEIVCNRDNKIVVILGVVT